MVDQSKSLFSLPLHTSCDAINVPYYHRGYAEQIYSKCFFSLTNSLVMY